MKQTHQATESSLLEADDARYAALNTSDLAALNELLTDDFTYTHNNGLVDDKEAYLARIRDGVVRYSDGARLDANARVHGNAGIITGHMQMVANSKDRAVQLDNIFLAAWVFEDGRWRCAAWASTAHPSD